MYNTLMSASWLYGFQPRLLVLRAGWYDFATRVAKPRVKAKSYHPNRKAILGQQEWLKSIQPRARINVLHSLIVLGTTYETGCMEAYIFFLTWYLPWFIIYILNYGYV